MSAAGLGCETMLPERRQILVVDDEPNLCRVLAAQLTSDGHEVHAAADGEQALAVLNEHHIDLVITDLKMPRMDGMALLRESLALDPDLPVILLTAHGTVDNAVEALKTGAFDYITKPFEQAEVRAIVGKALRARELASANATRSANPAAASKYGIIGDSQAIKQLNDVIERVADTSASALILGEAGTGKELVARALHENSSRSARPFIKLNCAAVPRELLELELFGYEPGAFAGAVGSKPGRFELAEGGTLFLDEISAAPIDIQVKIHRALFEKQFERVGGVRSLATDVRLIAASNVDLRREVSSGRFREDLLCLLNVVTVQLPPLRERVNDVLLLARHIIEKACRSIGKQSVSISPDAGRALQEYSWPGNIRELEDVIERAVLFCDGPELLVTHLPPQLRAAPGASTELSNDGLKQQVKAAVSKLERELIQKALDQTKGNVTHAARLLKLSRKGLQLKMKELGLRDERAGA